MFLRGLFAAFFVVSLAACASVVRGTVEQVQFNSEPPGATMRSIIAYECGGPCPQRDERIGSDTAYMNDDIRTPEVPGPACITTCTAQVARNQDLIVTFTKDGYAPQTVKLTGKLSGGGAAGVAGNIILGGAIGAVVDTGTGAALDHYPNPLKVVLVAIKSGPATNKRSKQTR